MSKPSTPERDILLGQQARLREFTGGADWHSTIGRFVLDQPSADNEPAAQIAPASVAIEPQDDGVSDVRITWVAVLPTERGFATALEVLADMRAALISQCPMGMTEDVGATVEPRESGSAYTVVSLTTATSIITEGRFDG